LHAQRLKKALAVFRILSDGLIQIKDNEFSFVVWY